MNKHAFTILEILMTFGILIILIVAVIYLLNPKNLLGRGLDARRKYDLSAFNKKLEEFHNDKGCYPRLDEVCYTGGANGDLNHTDTTVRSCFVCGTNSQSPSFSPYMDRLPCDPESPVNEYLYVITNSVERDCPQSYSAYTIFSTNTDAQSIATGCLKGGCGPNYGYDYGVASPNTNLLIPASYYCQMKTGACNQCSNPGTKTPYDDCLQNQNCVGIIYATRNMCCRSIFPQPVGCEL